MEVPLLSQDDFFRHLNLRSVHATSAKYHYRQALKERLRASSQTQSLSPPPSSKAVPLETKSPILSPVKWLTPKTRKKLFGRPKIRSEGRRILDFDNNLIKTSGSEEGLLKSLLSNCHVLRHPGVRQEVEAKIQCGTSKHFQLEDEFWEPPNSCIQIRKTYIKKTSNNPTKKKRKERKRKTHVIHYRPQPPIKDSETHRKKEQKISAALALYHSYKPLKDNGQNFSFKEFTKVFVTHPLLKSLCTNSPSIKLKKLTHNQLRMCQKPVEQPQIQPQNTVLEPIQRQVEIIQKTAYGRQVKPVLVPIKNETNVRCEHCDLTFSNLVNLKQHQVKKHQNLNLRKVQLKDHQPLCNPRSKIISNLPENTFHCDICYRRFAKRSRMIRHIKSVHSADIHRVDLNRFVLPTKKIRQLPTWSMIEL